MVQKEMKNGGGGEQNKTKQKQHRTTGQIPAKFACLFIHSFHAFFPSFFFFLPLLLSLHCFMNLCHARLTPLTPLEFSFAFMHKCTCNVKESAAKEKRHLQRHIKGKVKTQKAVSFAFLLLPFFILKKRTLCFFFFFAKWHLDLKRQTCFLVQCVEVLGILVSPSLFPSALGICSCL